MVPLKQKLTDTIAGKSYKSLIDSEKGMTNIQLPVKTQLHLMKQLRQGLKRCWRVWIIWLFSNKKTQHFPGEKCSGAKKSKVSLITMEAVGTTG